MSLIEEGCKEGFLNNLDNFIVDTSGEHSPSPDSSSTDGLYGDPSVLPHLGDQYQVEIPPLISETERLQLQNIPIDNVDGIASNFYSWKELAIPIIWVHRVANHVGHVQELLGAKTGLDAGQSHATTDSRPDFKCSSVPAVSFDSFNSHPTVPRDATCNDDPRNVTMPSLQSRKNEAWIPLPGLARAPWSDSESQGFLLGLYIFGKNLVQVQRFVGSKDMGDVLSFYYGRFYRSDAQCRWVECRKTRSRKSILGHRIFMGWRQQELLSRLLPNRAKEVQNTLLEVTKGFNEGASLEEFIFTLKSLVGIEALVEAVGIGKGKQDLTGIALDHARSNQVLSSRPEIPAGKACSSLTSEEIIKFLTGDFRLSKAKSNDLFWEAVWPRLLARGWHSEQPKDVSAISSKNALVFIIPGIKKFSRRKLTKGNHYFDSVSDVLNKVVSDPTLLEFEVEEGKESRALETVDTKVVPNGISDNPRPCYLRPRLPDVNSDLMKFTVVDTSLAHGGKPSKVRELRSLPADVTHRYNSSEQSSSGDASLNNTVESGQNLHDDNKVTAPKSTLPGNGHDLVGNGCEMVVEKPSVKGTKFQFSRRVKPRDQNSVAPISKIPRLTSCRSVGAGSRSFQLKEEVSYQTESVETNKEVAVDGRIPMEEINEAITLHEKSQPRTLIDLNLHPIDFDSEGPINMEVEGGRDDLKPNESLEADIILANEPTGDSRRHSTRNRPPTTKALEALACGFLSVGKERSTKASRSTSFTSRSSRRARKNVEGSLPASDANIVNPNPSIIDPSLGTDEEYSGSTRHMSLYDDSHVQSHRKETHDLLGAL